MGIIMKNSIPTQRERIRENHTFCFPATLISR